jgi:hypothetical protein
MNILGPPGQLNYNSFLTCGKEQIFAIGRLKVSLGV